MSFEAVNAARGVKTGRSATKFVLMALCDRATKDALAWPSIASLVAYTELDRKTVIRALDKLEALGLIEDTCSTVGKTKQVKVYRILIEGSVGGPKKRSHNWDGLGF